MDRIKNWYNGLSDQWRATLRTAWQSFVGVVLTFVLGVLAVATDLINGGSWEEAIADTSNLGRVLGAAVVSVLASVVAFAMNRTGAKAPASYTPPDSVLVTLYPDGYGTRMITLEEMVAAHGPKMHPEFARRFFAYMAYKEGALGVGGGWRDTQPDRPGFAPDGKSFHQYQEWASGIVAYAAVDLVKPNRLSRHVAPAWSDTDDAPAWGLHTFIRSPEEPWHIQPIETRGWQTWVDEGRQDPDPNFVLPGEQPTPPPVTPPKGAPSMFMFVVTNAPSSPHPETYLMCDGTQLTHITDSHAVAVFAAADVPVVRSDGADQTKGLIESCRTMNDSPPEWNGTGWQNLWNASR